MQNKNKIIFKPILTKNKNKIIILSSKVKLNELIKKYFSLDSKYNKLLKEIESKIKNQKIKHIDFTILNKDNEPIYIKVFIDLDSINNKNNYDSCRMIGFDIYKYTSINNISSFDLILDYNTEKVTCILEGILIPNYKFNKYKTENKKVKNIKYEISLINNEKIKKEKINKLPEIINCVYIAKDLTNEPANILTTKSYPKIIKDIIKVNNLPIKYSEINATQLKKKGMNLIYNVGLKNNKSESKLMILEYKTNSKKEPFILLGKGVTFDTGGINLKDTYQSLNESKADMAGSATIISFILGYSKLKGKDNIIVIVPLVENNIDSFTIKPGNVIKSYSGLTVEVTDTDAEGRLILADSLSYIVEKYPKSPIIEFSTLTGQEEELSCKQFSVIMGNNNEKNKNKLIKLGNFLNEELVEIPLLEKFEDKVKSDIADVKNYSSSCSADLILSGIFLKKFIKKNTNWTHIDIGGTAYYMKDINKLNSSESSGIGVRLLFDFFDS